MPGDWTDRTDRPWSAGPRCWHASCLDRRKPASLAAWSCWSPRSGLFLLGDRKKKTVKKRDQDGGEGALRGKVEGPVWTTDPTGPSRSCLQALYLCKPRALVRCDRPDRPGRRIWHEICDLQRSYRRWFGARLMPIGIRVSVPSWHGLCTLPCWYASCMSWLCGTDLACAYRGIGLAWAIHWHGGCRGARVVPEARVGYAPKNEQHSVRFVKDPPTSARIFFQLSYLIRPTFGPILTPDHLACYSSDNKLRATTPNPIFFNREVFMSGAGYAQAPAGMLNQPIGKDTMSALIGHTREHLNGTEIRLNNLLQRIRPTPEKDRGIATPTTQMGMLESTMEMRSQASRIEQLLDQLDILL